MSEYIPPANQLVDLIKGRGNWHSLIDALARLDPTYIDLPSIDRALPIQHFRYGLTIAQSKLSQHDPKSASKILYQLAEIVPADTYEEFWFIEVCIELYLQCQRPAAALEFCNEALGKVALENFPDQKTRFLTLRAKITNSLHELLQAKDKDLNEDEAPKQVKILECRVPKKPPQSARLSGHLGSEEETKPLSQPKT